MDIFRNKVEKPKCIKQSIQLKEEVFKIMSL